MHAHWADEHVVLLVSQPDLSLVLNLVWKSPDGKDENTQKKFNLYKYLYMYDIRMKLTFCAWMLTAAGIDYCTLRYKETPLCACVYSHVCIHCCWESDSSWKERPLKFLFCTLKDFILLFHENKMVKSLSINVICLICSLLWGKHDFITSASHRSLLLFIFHSIPTFSEFSVGLLHSLTKTEGIFRRKGRIIIRQQYVHV